MKKSDNVGQESKTINEEERGKLGGEVEDTGGARKKGKVYQERATLVKLKPYPLEKTECEIFAYASQAFPRMGEQRVSISPSQMPTTGILY